MPLGAYSSQLQGRTWRVTCAPDSWLMYLSKIRTYDKNWKGPIWPSHGGPRPTFGKSWRAEPLAMMPGGVGAGRQHLHYGALLGLLTKDPENARTVKNMLLLLLCMTQMLFPTQEIKTPRPFCFHSHRHPCQEMGSVKASACFPVNQYTCACLHATCAQPKTHTHTYGC